MKPSETTVPRLVQLRHGRDRRVAFVAEPRLVLLDTYHTVYDLAGAALRAGKPLAALVAESLGGVEMGYDEVYDLRSDWRILPPLDHPTEPARTLVSGTGLTHLGSARHRDAMHGREAEAAETALTDSMKMFRWGVERGKPRDGEPGVAPEWFYKGTAAVLRAHGEPLETPPHAEDGGEEAEIAGLYVVDDDGAPVRVGMAQGNEFSDHVFEKRNYLNLAGSKLRTAAVGPELVVAPSFGSIEGTSTIFRGAAPLWRKAIRTGEAEMCHSLANIEHHHFKFAGHRRPGDVHVHFFGADALSFGDGIRLQDGDVMEVHFAGFGRPLRNPLRAPGTPQPLITVTPL
ncbi:GguC protein [bacterium]|nr:GguC protein [bacterium]